MSNVRSASMWSLFYRCLKEALSYVKKEFIFFNEIRSVRQIMSDE
jgi:hypothetical protein